MARSKDQQRKVLKKKQDKRVKREAEKRQTAHLEKFSGGRMLHINSGLDKNSVPTTSSMPSEQIEDNVIKTLKSVGAPSEVIYAFKKTGLVVTNLNRDQFSEKELSDWDHAINEFRINV